MENINKLTEEQLDQITETMKDSKSEKSKEMQDIIASPVSPEVKSEVREYTANVTFDNETGLMNMSPVDEKSVRDINTVLDDNDDIEVDLDDPTIAKEMAKTYNEIELSEITKLLGVLKEYKENPSGNYFNKLPSTFKNMALGLAKVTKGVEEASRDLLKMIETQIKEDKTIVDFNDSINKAYGELNTVSMYGKYLRETIEINMVAGAEKQKAEGKIKEYEKTMAIVNAFKDSYTLKPLFDFVENNASFVRKLNKELKRIQRWVTDFNYKYQHSKLTIKNVSLMINPIMRAKESEITIDEVKKILIVFAKLCQNFKPENIEEHVFMYYFLHHAVSLDYLLPEDDIFKEYTDNIIKLSKKIEEIESQK